MEGVGALAQEREGKMTLRTQAVEYRETIQRLAAI
jgi:hypothetical protein